MNFILVASLISPDWLKYGFAGSVAIVNILLYFVIKPLIAGDHNKKFWAILFVLSSLVLLCMGGYSSFLNDKVKLNNKGQIDSVKLANQALLNRIQILTDRTPEGDSLRKKIVDNKKEYDSLVVVNSSLEQKVSDQKGIITEQASQFILQALESDFQATSGKHQLNIPDVNFKRIRGAVFMNMVAFDGDANILKQALNMYNQQTQDFSKNDINRAVALLPQLMRLRLRWLRDVAIPALTAKIQFLGQHPQLQAGLSAVVKIPEELIVYPNGENTVVVDNMAGLVRERNILVTKLSQP